MQNLAIHFYLTVKVLVVVDPIEIVVVPAEVRRMAKEVRHVWVVLVELKLVESCSCSGGTITLDDAFSCCGT